MTNTPENVLRISHLREVLGYACKQVALTGEPIIVQRYNRQEVILVPLADWRYYQQMEAELRNGETPPNDVLAELADEEND